MGSYEDRALQMTPANADTIRTAMASWSGEKREKGARLLTAYDSLQSQLKADPDEFVGPPEPGMEEAFSAGTLSPVGDMLINAGPAQIERGPGEVTAGSHPEVDPQAAPPVGTFSDYEGVEGGSSMGSGEAFARGADLSVTGGQVGEGVDTGAGWLETLGKLRPFMMRPSTDVSGGAQAAGRRRAAATEQGLGENMEAQILGRMAGAFVPGGAVNQIARTAGSAAARAAPGALRGLAAGAATGGLEATVESGVDLGAGALRGEEITGERLGEEGLEIGGGLVGGGALGGAGQLVGRLGRAGVEGLRSGPRGQQLRQLEAAGDGKPATTMFGSLSGVKPSPAVKQAELAAVRGGEGRSSQGLIAEGIAGETLERFPPEKKALFQTLKAEVDEYHRVLGPEVRRSTAPVVRVAAEAIRSRSGVPWAQGTAMFKKGLAKSFDAVPVEKGFRPAEGEVVSRAAAEEWAKQMDVNLDDIIRRPARGPIQEAQSQMRRMAQEESTNAGRAMPGRPGPPPPGPPGAPPGPPPGPPPAAAPLPEPVGEWFHLRPRMLNSQELEAMTEGIDEISLQASRAGSSDKSLAAMAAAVREVRDQFPKVKGAAPEGLSALKDSQFERLNTLEDSQEALGLGGLGEIQPHGRNQNRIFKALLSLGSGPQSELTDKALRSYYKQHPDLLQELKTLSGTKAYQSLLSNAPRAGTAMGPSGPRGFATASTEFLQMHLDPVARAMALAEQQTGGVAAAAGAAPGNDELLIRMVEAAKNMDEETVKEPDARSY